MRTVVALGGNALLRRGEPAEAAIQRAHVLEAAPALAALALRDELVITHGNGPQVGLLALEAEAYKDVTPYPLDVLGAETQGMIGYLLSQALRSRLAQHDVVALLTQVLVDPGDPAFLHPTKPIGPVYSEHEARQLARSRGWSIARDGDYFRRVVASPEPQAIVELHAIERLLAARSIVICAGGGGIPVVADQDGLHGVDAVIDKDLTAALLAEELDADRLIILTDVPHIERDWNTPAATPIVTATPADMRQLLFAPGSMAPKVEAACRFVERTGGEAVIASLPDLEAAAAGRAGTRITAPLAFALP